MMNVSDPQRELKAALVIPSRIETSHCEERSSRIIGLHEPTGLWTCCFGWLLR